MSCPDIPEPDKVSVILQTDRQFVGVRFVRGNLFKNHRSQDFEMVLHKYAVMEYGDYCGFDDLAVFENRAVEDNIITLPFSRSP